MNKMELIAAVAETADLPRARAADLVDAVFGAIEQALREGEEVRLVGFGSFARSERRAATGTNPRTGEVLRIPSSVSVRFRAGKRLRDAVGEAASS
jgi:DNA-binding protein HU-beta